VGLPQLQARREGIKEVKFVSLFAGVGGFDLGLTRSGHQCIGQVEIDKHARSVLDLQFPEIPKHDDVTTAIDWADEIGLTGNIDLVCGGFPCQDLSVAGKRAGLAGARSGLFYDALRFATHTKAETIILENVPGLLSSNQGRDFGAVLTALADSGYSNIEWRLLDSQFFGVPQRRRRVFIVASLGTKPFRQILSQLESCTRDSQASEQSGQDTARTLATGTGAGRVLGSDHVGALMASDYKFPQQQQVMENKIVVQRAYGQSSFAGFTEGVTTLTATDYKRPEQNVVVCKEP
jgi:DNA (cytosine-5)-methyltransferase 1